MSQNRTPEVMGVLQAAKGLGIQRESVYRLIRRGELEGQRIDGKLYVTRDSFDAKRERSGHKSQNRTPTAAEQLELAQQTIATLQAEAEVFEGNRRKALQVAQEVRSPMKWFGKRRETERRLERAAAVLEMLGPPATS